MTSHYPCSVHTYGAQMRVLNIGRLLERVGRVTLVIASGEEVDRAALERTRDEFEATRVVRVTRVPLGTLGNRIRFELDPSYLNTHFSGVGESDRRRMLRLMERHDVTWVHTIGTANEFRIGRWPRTVLDVDDMPSRVWASSARAGSGAARKLLDYRLSLLWRRRERRLRDRFDVIGVCSEADRRHLGGGPAVRVIPNGFARPSQPPRRAPAAPPRFGFIGLCTYPPNRTGLDWFIRRVWPTIKRRSPGARLRLVGLESDKGFPSKGPDVDGLGYVEDPGAEIATWTAMVVPIRTGGGTRIKIAEAFSRRCPVVSTRLGACGYEVRGGEGLLLADGARDFAAACVRLAEDRELAARLSEHAWSGFLAEWTWDVIGGAVADAVRLCLDGVTVGTSSGRDVRLG